MTAVRDATGRELVLRHPPRRVVSLVPSLTETVFALGRGDVLVGVTRYCIEPKGSVERLERVGGTKNPDLDRIRALQPDLVLLNAEENRQDDFAALQADGVTLFVSFPKRVRDVIELIRALSVLIDAREAAEKIAAQLDETLAEIGARPFVTQRPRVFCPIWKNPWMGFSSDTYAGDMLAVAGATNVLSERAERYCEVTLEEIAAAAPQVVLLPDEPYVFKQKDLPGLTALSGTPAWQNSQVRFIDGKALSWFGSRTASGLRYLAQILRQSRL